MIDFGEDVWQCVLVTRRNEVKQHMADISVAF